MVKNNTKFKETELGPIPEEWEIVTLPKVSRNLDSKRRPLSSAERERMKGEYPYYGAAGIIDWVNDFILDGKYLLVAEDGTVTDSFGHPTLQLTDGKFWVSNHAHVLQCESYDELKYIYYALKNTQITAFVTGAVQPKLNQENLNSIPLAYPTEATERNEISSILSSLDDKIELNRQINANLEKIASALFKRWFVDFEFPDKNGKPYKSSGGKMVESEMGEIPEGWRVGKVRDLVRVESGFPFSSSMFEKDGEYELVTIKNVQDGYFVPECTDRLNEIPIKMPGHCLLHSGDILLSLTGNVGRVCIVFGDKYLLNQRVAILIPIEPTNRAFTYYLFRQADFQRNLINISRGTAQLNLSPIESRNLEVIVPSSDVLSSFGQLMNPLFETVVGNFNQTRSLAIIRDSFLPRLMSGRIRVKI